MDLSWLFQEQDESRTKVHLSAQLRHATDPKLAIDSLRKSLRAKPHVSDSPEPEIAIKGFNLSGTVLEVTAHCRGDNYWQAFLETSQAIHELDRRSLWDQSTTED